MIEETKMVLYDVRGNDGSRRRRHRRCHRQRCMAMETWTIFAKLANGKIFVHIWMQNVQPTTYLRMKRKRKRERKKKIGSSKQLRQKRAMNEIFVWLWMAVGNK